MCPHEGLFLHLFISPDFGVGFLCAYLLCIVPGIVYEKLWR